jgi:hypothetical protein
VNISGDVPKSLCNKGSVAICLFKASFEMGGHFFRVLRCSATSERVAAVLAIAATPIGSARNVRGSLGVLGLGALVTACQVQDRCLTFGRSLERRVGRQAVALDKPPAMMYSNTYI